MRNKTVLLLDQYKTMVLWVNHYLSNLSDNDLKQEVIPGKNHGIWLLGHIIASDDDLSLYLGKGPLLFPEYDGVFTSGSKLKSIDEYPSAQVLREQWQNVVNKNIKIYEELQDEELEEPHAMIKGKIEDDYFKTKKSVIFNWMFHQVYEAGQLGVIKLACSKKESE